MAPKTKRVEIPDCLSSVGSSDGSSDDSQATRANNRLAIHEASITDNFGSLETAEHSNTNGAVSIQKQRSPARIIDLTKLDMSANGGYDGLFLEEKRSPL